jgi:curved DNA-binding protein CbpA
MQLVQRILRTKDYYQILEVPQDASEDTVKKAYKKLALKLHPDKNRAPGAEEAFKKLSKVVQCLSDAEKRDMYRRYGDEDRIPQQHRHQYEQNFATPEDFFDLFFGGGMHGGHHGRRHGNVHTTQFNFGQGGQQPPAMFQIALLLVLLLSFGSNMISNGSSSSRFSFSRTGDYSIEHTTATLDVPYYVTESFEANYAEGTQALAEFDQSVEIYHIRDLRSDCEYNNMLHSRQRGGRKRKDAEAARRANCQTIKELSRKHPRLYQAALGSKKVGDGSAVSRFSFTRSGEHDVRRSTATLEVPYFVAEGFEADYAEGTQTLADFEQSVEVYHLRSLRVDCEPCQTLKEISRRHPRLEQAAFGSSKVGKDPSARHFSLVRSDQHHVGRSTATLGVPYFVSEGFEASYGEGTRALADFEHRVEVQYLRGLKGDCDPCQELREINQKHPRLYQAAVYSR